MLSTRGTYFQKFGARYYDRQTGRFLTRDPLSGNLYSPQTLNQYIYCLNNPYRYTDPRGMETDDMHCQYVILPDGTISYELAELYNKLRAALEKLSEDDWAEIEGYLSSDDPKTKLKAVKEILRAAGIEFNDRSSYLTITLDKMTFTIDFADLGRNASGTIMGRTTLDKYNPNLGFIELSNKISSAGDLFLTLGQQETECSFFPQID